MYQSGLGCVGPVGGSVVRHPVVALRGIPVRRQYRVGDLMVRGVPLAGGSVHVGERGDSRAINRPLLSTHMVRRGVGGGCDRISRGAADMAVWVADGLGCRGVGVRCALDRHAGVGVRWNRSAAELASS